MTQFKHDIQEIVNIKSKERFDEIAMDLFVFHMEHNPIYSEFVQKIKRTSPNNVSEIPFLPISFFKTHTVFIGDNIQQTFSSSGTTGSITSKHHVGDLNIYETSFLTGFQHFYGKPEDFVILGLLPSYLEREGSSLVYMVDYLIKASNNELSGFYLHDQEALLAQIELAQTTDKKIILLGVSYALMDLADKGVDLSNCIIMETGGMKGKRKELTKSALHDYLKKGLNAETIHSEYGMTELLSQGYSKGNGVFELPNWMDIHIRQVSDPLTQVTNSKAGGINIIDLANIYSCPFIATEDLGKLIGPKEFEILGRFDHSDVRGCNLLVE